jgi:hypothetical protein
VPKTPSCVKKFSSMLPHEVVQAVVYVRVSQQS